MMGPAEMLETRALQFYRMGVRGWRSELGWRESADGKRDWDAYDKLFAAAEKAGCKLMVTLGGHSGWRWTFGYTFLYWSGVARPGDQIQLDVNPSQFPPPTRTVTARPDFQLHTTDFWAQGLNFGLAYRY